MHKKMCTHAHISVHALIKDVQSGLVKNRAQVIEAFPAGRFRGVHIRIKFQADVALIIQPNHGFENIQKPDNTVPGNQVIVNPGSGNVF